jgi:hypothetical protein
MANRKGIGGPNTPDGKQTSSQNAVKHSCCSSKRLVAGESAEDHERFWKMWIDRYHPSSDHDLFLIRTTVDAAWRMQHSERALANCEAKLYQQQPDSSLWTAEQHKQLQMFHRYKTADSNAFHKALRLIDSLRKSDKQDALLNDKIASKVIENLCQPKPLQELKRKANRLVDKPVTLPTNRDDGGCTCPPCLAEWGIAQYEKTIPPSNLPDEVSRETPDPV